MAFHNAQTPEDLPNQGEDIQPICRYCERPYFESESDSNHRGVFCSSECEAEYKDEHPTAGANPRELGDDDGQEYGDPREAQRERLERD